MPLHAYDLVIYTPLVVLAYELRWRWVASLLIALSLLAARASLVTDHLHVAQVGSFLTAAILITIAVGLAQRWRRVRSATVPRPPRLPSNIGL
jgi:hypothetical protein